MVSDVWVLSLPGCHHDDHVLTPDSSSSRSQHNWQHSGPGPSSDSDHLEAPHSSVLTLILTLLETGAVYKGFTFPIWKHGNTFKYDHARMPFLLTRGPLIYSPITQKQSILYHATSWDLSNSPMSGDMLAMSPQASHTRLRADQGLLRLWPTTPFHEPGPDKS